MQQQQQQQPWTSASWAGQQRWEQRWWVALQTMSKPFIQCGLLLLYS
jgi:hypothetical protein